MNKKNLIILITTLVILALLCGIYLIYDNYQFGLELYSAVNRMSPQTHSIAKSIEFLEEKFENGDIDDIAHDRNAFDQEMLKVHSFFGYDDMPLLNEVRFEYAMWFEEIFDLTANDFNNSGLVKLFTDKEESAKLAILKSKLNIMTNHFIEFRDRYNQLTFWERCFTNWRHERDLLSEQVKLP